VHGGSDGFRLFADYPDTGGGICNTCGPQSNGLAMLVFVKGYSYRDAVREVAQWLRKEEAEQTASTRPPPPPPAPKHDPDKAREIIRRIWTTTLPITRSAGERYLVDRGIWSTNVPPTLRFHPNLRYYSVKEKKFYGYFPALVAPIRSPKGEIIALHRIFLTREGKKAQVPEQKKMTSCIHSPNGGAIRLFPAGKVLGVGEGIETMLAVRAITRMPVWSAVNATLLEHIAIPPWVEHLVIWADKDKGERGQEAAEALAKRAIAEGKTVEIQIPPQRIPDGSKSLDWLDVLLMFGVEGFPEQWRIWKPAA
jgi:phage/plasmid primase-like uncharacterized protein